MMYREESLPLANPGPRPKGVIREEPDSFMVDEIICPEADDGGEHWWLRVEKRGTDTREMIRAIARVCELDVRRVGYSGLKDRHALTRQWLSLPWPRSRMTEDAPLTIAGFRVVEAVRSRRKLRVGSHRRNRFMIVLSGISDAGAVLERFEWVRRRGFPNYFGPQRFGSRGDNASEALRWFRGEARPPRGPRRSMLLSAARSVVFNALLGERVGDRNWDRLIAGDVAVLDGSRSFFQADPDDPEQVARCAEGDIHPGAFLAGRERSPRTDPGSAAAGYEERANRKSPELVRGIAEAGVQRSVRPLRAMAYAARARVLDADRIHLEFELGRGVFATSLIRELSQYRDAARSVDPDVR